MKAAKHSGLNNNSPQVSTAVTSRQSFCGDTVSRPGPPGKGNTYTDFDQALAPVMHEGAQMVDARTLHGWLGVGDPFSQWFRRRVREYGFDQPTDYQLHTPVKQSGRGGHNRRDYLLTIDTAKELSMVERTEIGRATSRYFIQMESAAIKMATGHYLNGTPEAIPRGSRRVV